ncbi:LysE family translocator [Paraburkholderia caballeronis]|uniref:LysE family translocator n=1 Tax=Paraburkholderia caballeronis TaxID=416943 RepID=UPI001064F648|nr:LysE family transporter [Paraburkholderia caballeronis]TDV02057.1 threonine/homoserine/homoserine lactone efflux protein [Paraburkholderia caballeronis]TDV06736.1 threonine/homoserine/homoserine lactone efflux protein [Paraburkholderia caballeronis]TDV16716.1 threonine/homoserine/homoserine lactone efflux protein [Paraburkholderia caballeronis]
MNYTAQLAAIAGVMLLACVSPGPDMLAVTSHAFARRRAGVFAAAGIATSHAIWATLAVFGLGLILAQLAWLYEAIRIAGGVYLLYLGGKTLMGLRRSVGVSEPAAPVAAAAKSASGAHAYRRGLLVGLTNPKAAAFFGSLFVTLLPAHAPLWVHGATIATVAGVSIAWFTSIALLFSTGSVQRGYAKLRRPVDALMGAALVALGARLALDH